MSESSEEVVVLRYRDGFTVRGRLHGSVPPLGGCVELTTEEGERVEAPFHELKAIFFLKDPRRRQAQVELGGGEYPEPPDSALTRVEFADGEIIRGRVQHFSVGDRGFFLFPTAVESNNERVFVVASAVASVDIEG